MHWGTGWERDMKELDFLFLYEHKVRELENLKEKISLKNQLAE